MVPEMVGAEGQQIGGRAPAFVLHLEVLLRHVAELLVTHLDNGRMPFERVVRCGVLGGHAVDTGVAAGFADGRREVRLSGDGVLGHLAGRPGVFAFNVGGLRFPVSGRGGDSRPELVAGGGECGAKLVGSGQGECSSYRR